MDEAMILWNKVRKVVISNPDFIKWPDNDKIELFMKDHKTFQNEFPIVCRYMICMGQYKEKAFYKYLVKVKNVKLKAPEKRAKGYMEDQWVDRQADYVRYLWEEYQHLDRKRFTMKESAAVWRQARNSIKEEFDTFREGHKKAEDKLAEEKKKNAVEKTKELIDRIKLGKQKLTERQLQDLLWQTRARVFAQRKDKMLKQLLKKVARIKPSRQAWGQVKEEEKKNGSRSSMLS